MVPINSQRNQTYTLGSDDGWLLRCMIFQSCRRERCLPMNQRRVTTTATAIPSWLRLKIFSTMRGYVAFSRFKLMNPFGRVRTLLLYTLMCRRSAECNDYYWPRAVQFSGGDDILKHPCATEFKTFNNICKRCVTHSVIVIILWSKCV